jgi:phage gp36-like protein
MYITIDELKTALYSYQAQEIAEHDSDILFMNIAAAEGEARSYLAGRYNVNAIFAATGAQRNQLLLELTKNIAVWYIVRLSNVDLIYTHAKERYDAAVEWLNRVADGKLNPDLPPALADGVPDGSAISWGSSEKRNSNDY